MATKIETKIPGAKVVQVTAPDRSSHTFDGNESLAGRKMGGGMNDLSHSITDMGKAAK
jgi:hypothetical protein